MSIKIQLDTPNEIHSKIKRLQLEKEEKGEKISLKELYYQILRKGLEAQQEKPTE